MSTYSFQIFNEECRFQDVNSLPEPDIVLCTYLLSAFHFLGTTPSQWFKFSNYEFFALGRHEYNKEILYTVIRKSTDGTSENFFYRLIEKNPQALPSSFAGLHPITLHAHLCDLFEEDLQKNLPMKKYHGSEFPNQIDNLAILK